MTNSYDLKGLVERLPDLLAKATPGPWLQDTDGNVCKGPYGEDRICDPMGDTHEQAEANGGLIALTPTLAEALVQLMEENERVVSAAKALVAKLDECAPHVANLSVIQSVRSGVGYSGPTYGGELEILRAALSTGSEEGENMQ